MNRPPICRVEPLARNRRTAPTLQPASDEVERAEPDSEHHCSPVLRSYAVTTGDSERRRGGAQRRPPPPLGLSKAHIPARQRKGSVTCYRGASLIQVRLRGDVAAGNTSGCGPRGEIVEFTPASRRRMLELLAKVEQAAVPLAFTLTYPDNFPLYREDYKGHLEAFCDRVQRRWPTAAIIWKLEFKARKTGRNKGKIAPHYHFALPSCIVRVLSTHGYDHTHRHNRGSRQAEEA